MKRWAGSRHRSYDFARDGFALLAMGFTGAKALHFKTAFLAAFNRMEAELQTRSPRDLGPLREVLLARPTASAC